jgi:hypothetical protein
MHLLINLLGFIIAFFFLDETLPQNKRQPWVISKITPGSSIGTLFHFPFLLNLFIGLLFLIFSLSSLSISTAYLVEVFSLRQSDGVLLSLTMGVISAIFISSSFFLLGKIGSRRLLFLMLGLVATGLTLINLGRNILTVFVIGHLVCSSAQIGQPAFQKLVTDNSDPKQQARIQSGNILLGIRFFLINLAFASAFLLGTAVGIVFHGTVFGSLSPSTAFVPYSVAFVALCISFLVVRRNLSQYPACDPYQSLKDDISTLEIPSPAPDVKKEIELEVK